MSAKQIIYLILLLLVGVSGFILRLLPYVSNYPFWLDECSLALSIMNRNIFGFFTPLEHIQSAPPFFMMLSKFITHIFGINEMALRFIPFITSIAAIAVFYILSNKIFKHKFVIISALLLFCVNYNLIYYANEFKQYSSDVLISMLMLLAANKIDFNVLNKKHSFLCGLLFFMSVLTSVPAVFVAGALILYSLKGFNSKKYLNILFFLIPFLILGPIFYYVNLLPTKNIMLSTFLNQWQSGFLTPDFISIIFVLRENLSYFFSQDVFVLFGVMLLVAGIILLAKSKNKASILITLLLLCAILASFLWIYPIKQRVALYLIPFLIIAILKPLDTLYKSNKILFTITLILTVAFFSGYNLDYFKHYQGYIKGKKESADEIMQLLKQGYNKGDVVVYNDASNSIYEFYSRKHNFYTDKYIVINLVKYSKDYYMHLLDALPKNNTYWFYYAHDYFKLPVVSFIEEWAKDKQVINEYKINRSYLLHVKL